MNIIEKVLNRQEFYEQPPVLIDIGASGKLHEIWKSIAKYSICIAFDADERKMEYTLNESSHYKKLYVYNRILTSQLKEAKEETFYLTKSPYCSSLLQPLNQKLADWAFADLFEVENKVLIKTVQLPTVLKELKLDRVDWFKTDSQGTDLRLFRSLGPEIISKIIVAEFEPGIMDAYLNEDKMHSVMSFMENYPFWLSDLVIKGTQRISSSKNINDNFNKLYQRFFSCLLKKSAFWGEMTYINTFEQKENLSKRDLLLGWIFCTINRQHGFAFEVAHIGKSLFEDQVFEILTRDSIRQMKRKRWRLPFYLAERIYNKYRKFF